MPSSTAPPPPSPAAAVGAPAATEATPIRRPILAWVGVLWGGSGVLALLVLALARLTPWALGVLDQPLRWYHWILLLANMAMMAYSEGYRGFQQAFSPRVVARLYHLHQRPRVLDVVLAPLFAMAYYRAPRKRRIVAVALTLGIVVLVVLVRLLPQPWRGIVDAGVVVGLGWGLVSLLVEAARALATGRPPVDPEIP